MQRTKAPVQRLRDTPGFIALYLCQFLGALNDNIFKSALLVIIAFRFADRPGEVALLNNLAAALLILPFLLVSPLAGQLADRGEKARMIRHNKLFELGICLFGMLALYIGSVPALLGIVFALGTQSALFGPNKYAVLPQLLPDALLVRGNAQVASATFVAILLGALLGGILARAETTWLWVGGSTAGVALLGLLAARRLPALAVAAPDLKLDYNFLREVKFSLTYTWRNPMIWLALIGISWFWFLGSAYLTQLPSLARFYLGGDETLVSELILVFILGVCGGAVLCAWLSDQRPELALVPLALLLISLVSLDLGLLLNETEIGQASAWRAGLDIHLLGWAGGLIGVPLYAQLQQTTALHNRARIIAVNNVANALFMISSALLGMLVLGTVGRSLGDFMLVLALLNLIPLIWFSLRLTRPLLRLLAQMAARLVYRIEVRDLAQVPQSGPALLVCNHVSYADAILLMAVIRRPVRFLMTRDIYERPWLKWVLAAAGCIPLASPLEHRATFQSAFASASESLKAGELVCIFPEGRLSPDGELHVFKRGFEKILELAPVPVVPLGIRGMWGSFFSHGEGPVLRKRPQWRRRSVLIRAGVALDISEASAERLRRVVADLLSVA